MLWFRGRAFSTADAVLNIGYSGQAAGYGLVDVLFNDPEGPSGKLTVTYYKPEQLGSIVDCECSNDRLRLSPVVLLTGLLLSTDNMSAGQKTYKWLSTEPFYPFGYGLSYSTFGYSELVVSPASAADPCAEVVVTALVTNTGHLPAAEIAQLYIHPVDPALTTAANPKLIDFGRTPTLAPGASAPLSFIVTPEHRSVVEDYDHSQQVPAGAWTLSVGGGQPAASGGLHGRISNQGRGPLAKCGK